MKTREVTDTYTIALRERLKELTCLYGIAQICAQPEISQEEILQRIIELLPPAWQYPEIAFARITLDGVSFMTPGFREGDQKQVADITINGKIRGVIEIFYVEEMPQSYEGPFLKEERNLIDTIAKQIALIIERRQAEEEKLKLYNQLLHADRLATIGMLAAGVAHELNEPIGNILGFAQLIKKGTIIPVSVKQDIEKIETASLQAREVIKKLLIFAHQSPPERKKINLNQIVANSLNFFEARCVNAGIELVSMLMPDLPDITADPAQLNQVLVNLITNALQAISGKGRITIKTQHSDNWIILTVEDTGAGMNKQILEKIFVPFFTTKDIGHGTGLGLPVVHGIITTHGGSIAVKSKIGQGTSFEIRLPAS
jgi:two-component system NtrC family sensor kinase